VEQLLETETDGDSKMKKWNQQYHDKFKAFALIHKVWDQKNLEKAWKRVKANKGSAGIP
jgi:hypothetical protein